MSSSLRIMCLAIVAIAMTASPLFASAFVGGTAVSATNLNIPLIPKQMAPVHLHRVIYFRFFRAA